MSFPLQPDHRVFIAGHRGMVGSAIMRRLEAAGYHNLMVSSRQALDLCDQAAVTGFFQTQKPDAVVLAAAKVGGIHANATLPAEFIYENLVIETNIIHQAFQAGVRSLLFLGSSCIYPRSAPQPMPEHCLLEGSLEPTNEPYAIAKIAGIKLCESYNRQYGVDYRSVMPTNLYGINDNFHPTLSHVIPALMRRFHEAKIKSAPEVEVWGTGQAKREFLYVDDLADACLHVMQLDAHTLAEQVEPRCSHITIGTGVDGAIAELVEQVVEVVGYAGQVRWNTDLPDGTPRKLLDVGRIQALGWRSEMTLEEGLRRTYDWFQDAAYRK